MIIPLFNSNLINWFFSILPAFQKTYNVIYLCVFLCTLLLQFFEACHFCFIKIFSISNANCKNKNELFIFTIWTLTMHLIIAITYLLFHSTLIFQVVKILYKMSKFWILTTTNLIHFKITLLTHFALIYISDFTYYIKKSCIYLFIYEENLCSFLLRCLQSFSLFSFSWVATQYYMTWIRPLEWPLDDWNLVASYGCTALSPCILSSQTLLKKVNWRNPVYCSWSTNNPTPLIFCFCSFLFYAYFRSS